MSHIRYKKNKISSLFLIILAVALCILPLSDASAAKYDFALFNNANNTDDMKTAMISEWNVLHYSASAHEMFLNFKAADQNELAHWMIENRPQGGYTSTTIVRQTYLNALADRSFLINVNSAVDSFELWTVFEEDTELNYSDYILLTTAEQDEVCKQLLQVRPSEGFNKVEVLQSEMNTILYQVLLNKVQNDKSSLAVIYSEGDSAASATQKLTLPTEGMNETTISWSSSKPEFIDNNGSVTRPSLLQGNQTVMLTATISKGSVTNTKTFTIIVKALSQAGHANLKNLMISSGTLSPAFNKEITSYTASVSSVVDSVIITPIVEESTSTVTVNGTLATQPIKLVTGANTIQVMVTATGGSSQLYTIVITKAAPAESNNDGSNTPSPTPTPEPSPTDESIIFVNGEKVSIGQTVQTTVNNHKVVTLTADTEKLLERLETAGNKAIVTIPINDTSADIVIGELNGEIVKNMENKQASIVVQTPTTSYTLPAQEINIDAISQQLGETVALKDIKIHIEIANVTEHEANLVDAAAKQLNSTLVAKPVDFKVTYTFGNMKGDISKFNAYVERTIALPDGADVNKITTGIVVRPDGTTYHVPTKVVQKEGKYFAVINSLTNSLYTVVWHPIEFEDVNTHWAKNAINNLGSRFVIEGTSEGIFQPNKDITRSQFVAIMVRGLGLKPSEATNSFSDVAENAWYKDYLTTATEYNLIQGYGNGKFGPNDKITRQQAMTILARALTLTIINTDITDKEVNTILAPFKDKQEIADFAKRYIALSVKAGLVTGRSNQTIAPAENISRAEVAVIIERFLKTSQLID
ncbi:S-layer homology domain-containing protein [Lysinibacillus sp. NPDC097195]|uniref:S-layer homology domain-containing protein n=1 Tax=Lysinibacillus sp. NPDC097195 TaxID=3364141 RepID=UPI003812D228